MLLRAFSVVLAKTLFCSCNGHGEWKEGGVKEEQSLTRHLVHESNERLRRRRLKNTVTKNLTLLSEQKYNRQAEMG